jgi:CRP-like cAMP-binding protein
MIVMLALVGWVRRSGSGGGTQLVSPHLAGHKVTSDVKLSSTTSTQPRSGRPLRSARDTLASVNASRDALTAHLASELALPPALAGKLAAEFRVVQHGAGHPLMAAGSRDRSLYLLESGLLRVYYTTTDGKEFNKAFVREGMFFVALSAYLTDGPLCFAVQTLEPVRAYRMPYPRFHEWVEREPSLARAWRRYMEAHFVRHEAREAALQLEDADGRYRWFLEQHPGLIERVPLYHVASYLGLTNVTLSRVRRRLAARS